MDSTAKLTRQGVRDLDFGWKKKPVAPPDQKSEPIAVADAEPIADDEREPVAAPDVKPS